MALRTSLLLSGALLLCAAPAAAQDPDSKDAKSSKSEGQRDDSAPDTQEDKKVSSAESEKPPTVEETSEERAPGDAESPPVEPTAPSDVEPTKNESEPDALDDLDAKGSASSAEPEEAARADDAELAPQETPQPDDDSQPGGPQVSEEDPEEDFELPDNFVDTRAGSLTVEETDPKTDLPVAGYERSPGTQAFIQSEDGAFRLQIGAYAQIRWTANWREVPAGSDGEDFSQGWSLRRAQFFFEGKFTDRFAYHLRPVTANSGNLELQAAWLEILLAKRWSVRLGKQFMPLFREDWMFPMDLLASEASAYSATFAFGSSYGAFLRYGGDRHRVWGAIHNGTENGTEAFEASNHHLVGSARWEWSLVGDDWSIWSDQVGRRGRPFGLMFGMGALRAQQFGESASGDEFANQFHAELNINGDGYQGHITGTATRVDPVQGEGYFNYGALGQFGYFVHENLQLFTRYTFVSGGNDPAIEADFHSIDGGVNLYPFTWTNRWKFSAEGGALLTALNDTLVAPSPNQGYLASDRPGQGFFRVQAQFGF